VHVPANAASLRAAARNAKRPANYRLRLDGPPLQRWGRDSAALLAIAGALSIVAAGCRAYSAPPDFRVTLAGGQIPVELVTSWLSEAEDHRFAVQQVNPVYLSQHGFDHLRDGTCDIACTDRRITPREYAEFGERGVKGYRVAFYGYALYVHPDNPIDSLFAGHISLLFQKKITDWKELGPYEGPIRLIGPHKSTRGGEILMRQAGVWFAEPTWEPLESDVDIVAAVAADPLALGFASVGFDQGVRYLGLRMHRTDPPAFPSLEEIESERYGLAKVIYVYLPAEPSAAARAVLDYLLSERGRRAMESTRVWPIPPERAAVEMPR
jgi:phosphate transport system substrate-binding protein